jgi:outer membrane protein
MKTKIFFQSLILSFFCIFQMHAQELLTLEDAVKIALENNYEIKIAKNDLRIDQTNSDIGNAGMLPTVTASIVDNNGIQNASQTRTDGTITSVDNAQNSNINYGVGLDWTVLDGFKIFSRRDHLKELQKLGESPLKMSNLTKKSDVK